MCDPFTLTAAAVAGGGELFKGIAGSIAQENAGDVAAFNARMLGLQAESAEASALTAAYAGARDESLVRRKGEHVLADDLVRLAAGHVDPTYGSPLVLQGFSAAQIETDAQIMKARTAVAYADAKTGAANVWGQAYNQAAKASAHDAASMTSLISGVISAGTQFLYAGSKWASLGGSGAGSNVFALNTASTSNTGGMGFWG